VPLLTCQLSEPDVSVVFFHPGPNGLACLSNVDLTTFTGDAVHTWGLQPLVVLHRTKAAGDFGKQANGF
jgi:proteasome lid subunit RPN8/RPN11